MELRNLLNRFNKKTEKNRFLALELYDGIVKSFSWEISEGRTKVVKPGSIEEYKVEDLESFINAVDQSFTHAVEGLEGQPQGVIFGLPETWLEKEEVVDEKKKFLKLVCKKFELSPLGFVQTQEALLQFFRLKEGTPLNAIFARLTSEEVFVWVIKNGKILGEQSVGRSDDLGADVEEGLARFKDVEAFPPRIILFDNDSIDQEVKDQLDSYSWQEKLAFLHVPKIESLSPLATVEAVAVAGGSEAARSLGFTIRPPKEQKASGEVSDSKKTSELETALPTAADLGFVQNQDVAEVELKPVSIEKQLASSQLPVEPVKPDFQTTRARRSFSLKGLLKKVSEFFGKITGGLKKVNLSKLKERGRLPWLIGGVLVIFLAVFGLLFAAWWYLPKADVVIYLEPKVLEEAVEVLLDPQLKTADLEKRVLPAEAIEIVMEDSKSVSTTGEGLVGDPAKGEATIYNKTDLEKTFKAGTVLVGPDSLKFKFDEEVTVASQSAQDEGVVYGKGKVNITASFIGSEGNLSAGTEFSFKEYPLSVYGLKTESGLTGGTSRQVKTVNADDQEGLLASLTEELETRAFTELREKFTNKKILDKNILSEVLQKEFNHQVNDEADSLSLTLKVKSQTLAFSQEVFDSMMIRFLQDSVPNGFVLFKDNLEMVIREAAVAENLTAKLDVFVKAKLIPQIEEAAIKDNLTGRYPPLVQEYLRTLPNFVSADIIIKPPLPAKLNTLPHKVKNINLEVKIKP